MAINSPRNEDDSDHHHPNDNNQHIIQLWQVRTDRLAAMHQKISSSPKILTKSAGKSSCSIFRVPQSFVDINGKAYHPQVVSVGPYHHGEPHLEMIQEHKWRFLGALLKRTQSRGISLEDYLKAVQPLESAARGCYSEAIRFDTEEFIEMLVLDGCFVIELFRKIGGVVPFEEDDPLYSMSCVYSFLSRDLIKLENQIPLFVLNSLFELSRMPGEQSGPNLATLALNFFNYMLQRPKEFLEKCRNFEGKHLLDFLRTCFIPLDQTEPSKPAQPDSQTDVIHCISKLRRAGIKLRQGSEESFLAVKFRRGVIEMPTITIDDFMSSFLFNCVAYEQCHSGCSKHMTTYATFLDCLINSQKDVEYLGDCNIIDNYFGTDAEVAKFINNLGKDVSLDVEICYLAKLFDEINGYYRSSWHVQWASFKYTYFNTPWSFISALAAFVLLVLTVLQALFSLLSYYSPKG